MLDYKKTGSLEVWYKDGEDTCFGISLNRKNTKLLELLRELRKGTFDVVPSHPDFSIAAKERYYFSFIFIDATKYKTPESPLDSTCKDFMSNLIDVPGVEVVVRLPINKDAVPIIKDHPTRLEALSNLLYPSFIKQAIALIDLDDDIAKRKAKLIKKGND